MTMLAMRFDLRAPDFGAPARELYAASVDMAAWAEDHGFDFVVLSEHHGADDGYLPAPLALAGAIVGRTSRISVNVAALLVPLHDPVRLAEELAVLDLASGGRVSIVAGAGYRPEEFEMAGVARSARGKLLEEHVRVMLDAWSGEPFDWQGRTIRVTPRPFTQPHPMVMIGGSTEVAARRAARLRLPLFPAIGDPQLVEWYEDECAKQGFDGGFAMLPHGPAFVFVTRDVDAAWERIGRHVLHEVQVYDAWQTAGQRSQVHVQAKAVDDVRASGLYQVVTPEECIALAEEMGRAGTLVFHPLIGGLEPAVGQEMLELLAAEVLPRLQ